MIRKKWYILLSMVALLLYSCAGDKIDYADWGIEGPQSGASGAVMLNLSAVEDNHLKATRADEVDDLQLDLDQFKVVILNSKGLVARQWSTYAEVKEQPVKLNVGNYTLRASFGSPKVAGFTGYHFVGTTQFGVAPQSQTSVSTVCKLANVKVAVVYGEQLIKYYPSFKTEIKGVSGNTVTFARDEKRAAYFPVGDLQLKLFMTDKNGKTVSYMPDLIAGAAQDFITVHLDLNVGNIVLKVVTDTATDEKEIETELPPFMATKDAPTISASNFVDGWDKELFESALVPSRITLHAPGVIRSAIMTVNSQQLFAKGWPAECDLAKLDDQTKAIFKRDGLIWHEDINGTVLSDVDFSNVAKSLIAPSGGASQHSFSIKVVDAFSQEGQGQTLSFKVQAPEFTLQTIGAGDVWAKKATVNVDLKRGAADGLVIERKLGDDWVLCAVKSKVIDGQNVKIELSELNPNSTYSFRARYGTHVSAEQNITTETTSQIPNSGFETWYNKQVYKKTMWSFGTTGLGINEYFPYADGDASPWWSSRNPLTTSQRSGVSCYYTSYSGTINVPGRTGQAAQISTIGWGEGNTYPGNPDIVYNRTAGMLFVGSYNLGSKTEVVGKSFTSRPSEVVFYYKYAPQGGESFKAYVVVENRDSGVVELGRAELVSGDAKGEFTQALLPIVYTNTSLKATHIYVSFISSTSDSPTTSGVAGSKGLFDGYSDSKNVGSTLTIDDLELIY